jgi:hypothetical protein
MQRKRRTTLVGSICAVWLCLGLGLPVGAWACTLFGLVGSDVSGGGTLVVKNRDWRPDHSQEVAVVAPGFGYRFVGLFARGGDAPGLRAGVNQAGLTVISATAGSIPREERRGAAGLGGRLRRLLAECGSVREALARTDLFQQAKPCMFLLADRREVARVEVAPGGRYVVSHTASAPLFQTNHYLEPSLADANVRIGASSQARADRIRALLEQASRPANLEDLLGMSRDTEGGPDNGIWRTGKAPGVTRTMATFAVAMPPSGPGRLVVRLANPEQPERTLRVVLDEQAFDPAWGGYQ